MLASAQPNLNVGRARKLIRAAAKTHENLLRGPIDRLVGNERRGKEMNRQALNPHDLVDLCKAAPVTINIFDGTIGLGDIRVQFVSLAILLYTRP